MDTAQFDPPLLFLLLAAGSPSRNPQMATLNPTWLQEADVDVMGENGGQTVEYLGPRRQMVPVCVRDALGLSWLIGFMVVQLEHRTVMRSRSAWNSMNKFPHQMIVANLSLGAMAPGPSAGKEEHPFH